MHPENRLFFKAYVHDLYSASPSPLNGRLFVLILDANGNNIVNANFKIESGKTSGTLDLPADLMDGKYKLVGLTGLMQQGKVEHVFSKELFIKESIVPSTFIMLSAPDEICPPMGKTRVNVRLYTLKGKPYNKDYSYFVKLNGEIIHAGAEEADKTGRSVIRLELPDYEDQSIVSVEVAVEQRDQIDRNSIQIPTRGFPLKLNFYPEGGNLIHGSNTNIAFTAFGHTGEPVQIEGDLVDANDAIVGNITSLADGLGRFRIKVDKTNPIRIKITEPNGISELIDLPEIMDSGISLQFNQAISSELQFSLESNLLKIDSPIYAIAEKNGNIVWTKTLDLPSVNAFSIPVSGLGVGVVWVSLLNDQGQLQACRAVYLQPLDPNIAVSSDKARYSLKDDPNLQVKHENNPAQPFDCSISITDSRLNPNWNNVQDIFSFFTIGPSVGKFDFPTGFFNEINEEKEEIIDCIMLTQQDVKFDWQEIYSGERQATPTLPAEFMARVMEEIRSDKNEILLAEIESDQFIYKYVLPQDRGIPGYFWENRKELHTGRPTKLPSRQERITNLLRGGTPILDVIKQIKHYRLTNNKIIFGGPNSLVNQDGALIVVDGIKMGTEASFLNTLNPMDIHDIEVFTDPNSMARYTSLNGVGVISITTRGRDTDKEKEENQAEVKKEDKALLLWDPLFEIQPDEVLEIALENKEMKTEYNVIIQGTDKQGHPVFSKSQFSVY